MADDQDLVDDERFLPQIFDVEAGDSVKPEIAQEEFAGEPFVFFVDGQDEQLILEGDFHHQLKQRPRKRHSLCFGGGTFVRSGGVII
ncbi:MAG TPA: hypothetical protein VLH40_05055 [Atribacteraceae bacterium]|nr:hypothetical protein [Atribacteraceae bacterium]